MANGTLIFNNCILATSKSFFIQVSLVLHVSTYLVLTVGFILSLNVSVSFVLNFRMHSCVDGSDKSAD